MKYIVTLIAVLSFGISYSQTTWSKSINNSISSRLLSVQQTADSGYIASGYIYDWVWSSYGYDYTGYIIKTDKNGNTVWDFSNGKWSESIQQTKDGGFVYNYSWEWLDNYITYSGTGVKKINELGISVCGQSYSWAKASKEIKQTFDGGYSMSGSTLSSSFGYPFLLKTDSCGDSSWVKIFMQYNGSIESFQQTSDSGYILVGYTYLNNKDFLLIKTNINGDTIWTKTFGGPEEDIFHSIQKSTDGGYVIAGSTKSSGNGADIYITKIDSIGNPIWIKTYGGVNDDIAYSVQQTFDGGYIIAGYTKSFGAGNADIYIIKTDSIGNTVWTKTYGSADHDAAYSIQQTLDSGYIIAGYNSYDGYLLKTDVNGDTILNPVIINKNDNLDLTLYPNPFSTSTTIELPSEPHTLTIYDIVGNKVREEQVSGTTTIERGDLTKGMYVLEVRSDNQTYSGKLVVDQ